MPLHSRSEQATLRAREHLCKGADDEQQPSFTNDRFDGRSFAPPVSRRRDGRRRGRRRFWRRRQRAAAESPAPKAKLWIGAATADITPTPPVALTGFQTVRITRTIQSPPDGQRAGLGVAPGRSGDRPGDPGLVRFVRHSARESRRRSASTWPPGCRGSTSTSSSWPPPTPIRRRCCGQNQYDEKDYGDAMQPKDYVPFLYERMAEAVVKAWESRAAGAVAWGLGHAVVGHNRRVVYADGQAKMLGNTNDPQFRHIEGYEDHAVDILCFYDDQKRLKATAIAAGLHRPRCRKATPSSAPISGTDARELLRQRYGKELCVLGFCAPAGDQCPHLSYRKKSEARMDRLRGLTRTAGVGPPDRRRVRRRRRRDRQGHPHRRAAGPPGPAGRSADADRHRRRIRHRQEGLRRDRRQEGAGQAGCVDPQALRRGVRALPGPAEGRSASTRWRCTCSGWATWRSPPIRSSCTSTTACRSRPAARPSRRS